MFITNIFLKISQNNLGNWLGMIRATKFSSMGGPVGYPWASFGGQWQLSQYQNRIIFLLQIPKVPISLTTSTPSRSPPNPLVNHVAFKVTLVLVARENNTLRHTDNTKRLGHLYFKVCENYHHSNCCIICLVWDIKHVRWVMFFFKSPCRVSAVRRRKKPRGLPTSLQGSV